MPHGSRLSLAALPGEVQDALHEAHVCIRQGDYSTASTILDSLERVIGEHAEIMKLRLKTLLRRREFAAAADKADDYAGKAPHDTELLYLVSYVYKCARKTALALDYGERVHLRRPDHEKNLVNLADVVSQCGAHRAIPGTASPGAGKKS